MKNYEIINDFKQYEDEFGMINPDIGHTSGNGNYYTAHYVLVLAQQKNIDLVDMSEEFLRLRCIYKKNIMDNGILMRNPLNQWGKQGPDDYFGIALAAYVMSLPCMIRPIIEYGRSTFPHYVFNNIEPKKITGSAWMGRRRDLIGCLKIAAYMKPSLFDKIILLGGIFISSFDKKEDFNGWLLNYTKVKICEDKGWLFKMVCKKWKKNANKHFKTIGEMYACYFNNHKHPLVKWNNKSF